MLDIPDWICMITKFKQKFHLQLNFLMKNWPQTFASNIVAHYWRILYRPLNDKIISFWDNHSTKVSIGKERWNERIRTSSWDFSVSIWYKAKGREVVETSGHGTKPIVRDVILFSLKREKFDLHRFSSIKQTSCFIFGT